MSEVLQGALNNITLASLVGVLPDQGCIELQNDQPNHIHEWHDHKTDETLIIISGCIVFGVGSAEIECGPGDYITLPAGTRHKSTASNTGCIYTICFRDVSHLLEELQESSHG